jgi:hypothetical protein
MLENRFFLRVVKYSFSPPANFFTLIPITVDPLNSGHQGTGEIFRYWEVSVKQRVRYLEGWSQIKITFPLQRG